MKYFIDTEFIEGFWNAVFYKRRHFIDLISIGIVAEDGREYYAISSDFNVKDADSWVRENVIDKLDYSLQWKNNVMIANDIQGFCYEGGQDIEFYGYYADYDWVLFCSLFGRMIDLPKGFPMYCKDLKQMLDEKAKLMSEHELLKDFDYDRAAKKYPAGTIVKENVSLLKGNKFYPQQENEHNALADAKWNYELYKFLQSL